MVSQSVSVRFLCLFGCFHISRMWQKAVLVRFVDRMRTVSFLASTFIGRLAWKVSCDWWWGAGRWNHSQLFHTWVSPLWGQHEQMLWRRTFCLLPGHWRTLRKVPVVIIIITLTTNDYILLYHTKDKYIQQDVRKQQLLLCVVLQSHFVPVEVLPWSEGQCGKDPGCIIRTACGAATLLPRWFFSCDHPFYCNEKYHGAQKHFSHRQQ